MQQAAQLQRRRATGPAGGAVTSRRQLRRDVYDAMFMSGSPPPLLSPGIEVGGGRAGIHAVTAITTHNNERAEGPARPGPSAIIKSTARAMPAGPARAAGLGPGDSSSGPSQGRSQPGEEPARGGASQGRGPLEGIPAGRPLLSQQNSRPAGASSAGRPRDGEACPVRGIGGFSCMGRFLLY